VNSWESRSLTFVAPSDAASRSFLIFAPYRASSSGFGYAGLDAVSLNQVSNVVPEPASLVLSGLGVCGVMLLKKRQRRAESSST
jgi:hypothetical protein